MRRQIISASVAAGLLLGGCSSKPRQFAPTLTAAPADQAQFDLAHAECRQLLADGKLNASGRLASGAVGAAAGATTVAIGSAVASGAGLYGGMAIAGATLVALPFVAIGGAWGMAKRKQKRKERAIQTATAGCLEERGYRVAGWARAHRKDEAPSR